mmetsp:Transcript_45226/g.131610  ORF Transcript_45226/g.131610 Transcript_45226/m.131610 type:complete len:201 (+) Transcript_45226:99-701(+)
MPIRCCGRMHAERPGAEHGRADRQERSLAPTRERERQHRRRARRGLTTAAAQWRDVPHALAALVPRARAHRPIAHGRGAEAGRGAAPRIPLLGAGGLGRRYGHQRRDRVLRHRRSGGAGWAPRSPRMALAEALPPVLLGLCARRRRHLPRDRIRRRPPVHGAVQFPGVFRRGAGEIHVGPRPPPQAVGFVVRDHARRGSV